MPSDFNGDGRTDTVIADPYATVGGVAEAGRVIVLYGDSDGLIGEGARNVVAQGLDSVSGTPDAGDRFGFALAVGDLNCDEYTDLVVGTPYEDVDAASDSGYVQVIWGAATGVGTGDSSTQYTQTAFGNAVVAGDQFGYALDVLEDLDQSGTPEQGASALVIGAPGTNVSGENDAGWVGVLQRSDGERSRPSSPRTRRASRVARRPVTGSARRSRPATWCVPNPARTRSTSSSGLRTRTSGRLPTPGRSR